MHFNCNRERLCVNGRSLQYETKLTFIAPDRMFVCIYFAVIKRMVGCIVRTVTTLVHRMCGAYFEDSWFRNVINKV